MTPNRYYQYDQSTLVFYTLHNTLKTFFSNQLFSIDDGQGGTTGDLDRLVYASNDYALRKRSDDLLKRQVDVDSTHTQLDFPFLSYKRTGIDFDPPLKWHNQAFMSGIYIDDLQQKVYLDPVSISFEGTAWASTESDIQWMLQQFRFIADGVTEREVEGSLVYNPGGVTIPIWSQLSFNSINLDPSYQENDWLEKNKIHTIGLDFQLNTYLLRFGDPIRNGGGNANWSVTEKVILDFQVQNCLDNITYEETIELMYSELVDP